MASLYRFIQKLYHNNVGVPVIMTHRLDVDVRHNQNVTCLTVILLSHKTVLFEVEA